jgi:hypothetical protein
LRIIVIRTLLRVSDAFAAIVGNREIKVEVRMNRLSVILLVTLLAPALLFAGPNKPDIVVMTQNQYLGADLTPIITASTPGEYAVAVLDALESIAYNDITERAESLAATIIERDAHLVGLQEMFAFQCIESGTIAGACFLFDGAMNDHLQLTMAALGGQYVDVAVVNNLVLPTQQMIDAGLPGLPVFLDASGNPAAFIAVTDRDVILARSDVTALPVPFGLGCAKPSDMGCNYQVIAAAEIDLDGPGGLDPLEIPIERGWVGVDAEVDGTWYRFVNTHLEVRYPDASQPLSAFIQAAQATELLATLAAFPMLVQGFGPPADELLVVGDINSAPEHPVFQVPDAVFNPDPAGIPVPVKPPYMQLADGTDLFGTPLLTPGLTDVWNLRPGKPKGHTCCEAADLGNPDSQHDERIDVIFSLNEPSRVKANVLNNNPSDKTPSGLWPSDHATVVGRLWFD